MCIAWRFTGCCNCQRFYMTVASKKAEEIPAFAFERPWRFICHCPNMGGTTPRPFLSIQAFPIPLHQ